jgi:hypothetical protein
MVIKDLTKFKITKIRDYRINFRYEGILYSLNVFTDGCEDTIGLVNRETGEICGYTYERINLKKLIRTNYYTNSNIVYAHVDKEYLVKEMAHLKLIKCETPNKKFLETEIKKIEFMIKFEENKIENLKEKLIELNTEYEQYF